MAAYSPRTLEKALVRKGFEKDNTHHKMLWFHVDGKKTAIRTRISHDGKDYGDSLLGEMSKQVRLPRKKFTDLIECPMSVADYVGHLRNAGVLEPSQKELDDESVT